MIDLARYSKFITALVGAVATAISLGLVPQEYENWVAVAISFFTALGVYAVPNQQQASTGSPDA